MPKKKNAWNFNWRILLKTEIGEVYKLTTKEQEDRIEGIIMLILMNEEMLYMNNIEVIPHNYGTKGKVADCLIAFPPLLYFP